MTKNTKIIVGVISTIVVVSIGIYFGKRLFLTMRMGVKKDKPDNTDFNKALIEIEKIHPELVAKFNSYDDKKRAKGIELVTRDWVTFNRWKNGAKQRELTYQYKQEFDF